MGDIFDEAKKELDIFDTIPEGGEWPTNTITGKPMLSSMEKVQMGKEGALEALPIMGDIAGSLMAPQKKLLTSAPKLANLAWKGANLLSRGIGSGVGSGAGEEWKQEFSGESDPQSIMNQAKLGFAGEVGTSIFMGALKPLVKPLSGFISDVTGILSGTLVSGDLISVVENYG